MLLLLENTRPRLDGRLRLEQQPVFNTAAVQAAGADRSDRPTVYIIMIQSNAGILSNLPLWGSQWDSGGPGAHEYDEFFFEKTKITTEYHINRYTR